MDLIAGGNSFNIDQVSKVFNLQTFDAFWTHLKITALTLIESERFN